MLQNLLSYLLNSLVRVVTYDFFKIPLIFLFSMVGVFGVIAIIKKITGWRSM